MYCLSLFVLIVAAVCLALVLGACRAAGIASRMEIFYEPKTAADDTVYKVPDVRTQEQTV